MVKAIGYVLGALGLIGLAAWSIPDVKTAAPWLEPISDTMLLSVSLILLVIGILFAFKGGRRGKKVGREVPIYHGKSVVGYRRN